MGAFMAGMKIKNKLIAQSEYLSKVFKAIHEHLVTEYPHIGADELKAARQAYSSHIMESGAVLQTFDMQSYRNATDKLIVELGALREAFARNGIDITELWTPFVQGILEHVALVEKLEG